jgi:hypothetical protein
VLVNHSSRYVGSNRQNYTNLCFNVMKTYEAPKLTEYGPVEELTGIFGDVTVADTSYYPNGDVLTTGEGSIDQCATTDQQYCLPD